ncbi:GNAT family N-acetyltransferase [Quadrisphaera sp. INWT6]|uniref:GNAT family N-acetyltransferase n=1 Tax=Quadrisphaera sp. INWT6 TaxID=2596917 RepID=UPI0018925117|nr:GNAT family N-acetyltransferase [Quadrisphaera sp. INWT6]MBF5082748.1 GNAT family N-acetyltransferase [Quadrisphaera sp. INWT6]
MDEALTGRVRQLWGDAAGVPVTAFTTRGLGVTAAAGGSTAPPGWCGAVVVGDRALVTAPDGVCAGALGRALTGAGVTDYEGLLGAVTTGSLPGVEEVLGPAWLSYGVPGAPCPHPTTSWVSEELDGARRGDLVDLVEACSAEDVTESAVEDLVDVHVARDASGVVVAAAGWECWAAGLAHVGVLTAPRARGTGAASAVAGAAVEAALRQGLLVQWRAQPPASRRLAERLGLVEVGWQLCWR